MEKQGKGRGGGGRGEGRGRDREGCLGNRNGIMVAGTWRGEREEGRARGRSKGREREERGERAKGKEGRK